MVLPNPEDDDGIDVDDEEYMNDDDDIYTICDNTAVNTGQETVPRQTTEQSKYGGFIKIL